MTEAASGRALARDAPSFFTVLECHLDVAVDQSIGTSAHRTLTRALRRHRAKMITALRISPEAPRNATRKSFGLLPRTRTPSFSKTSYDAAKRGMDRPGVIAGSMASPPTSPGKKRHLPLPSHVTGGIVCRDGALCRIGFAANGYIQDLWLPLTGGRAKACQPGCWHAGATS